MQNTTSTPGSLSGFILDLGSLYRDVKVAETQGELNNLNGTQGAETVPDTEATEQRDVSGIGAITRAGEQYGISQPVFIGGSVLAIVGAGILLSKLFR